MGRYIRRFAEIECPPEEFSSICVGQFDSAVLMKSSRPPDHTGSEPHRHLSNQYYYVVEGTLVVVIAGRGILRRTERADRHPGRLSALQLQSDPRAGVPPRGHLSEHHPDGTTGGDDRPGHPRRSDDRPRITPDGYRETETVGLGRQWLLNLRSGGDFAAIAMDRFAPGSGDQTHHIHPFDEFYFVTEGTLSVDLAGEEETIEPYTLVCVPAGVAHRVGNDGANDEAHLLLVIPEPPAGKPWQTVVDFIAAECRAWSVTTSAGRIDALRGAVVNDRPAAD